MAASKHILLFLALAAALSGCRQPGSYEQFVLARDAADGVYRFFLDMTDSTATYDISFYTPPLADTLQTQLIVDWGFVSVEGSFVHRDTVWMPLGEVCSLYRSGVRPYPADMWEISVTVLDPPEDFRGLGIICKRNGTR